MENKKEKLIGVGILFAILIGIILVFVFTNNKNGQVEEFDEELTISEEGTITDWDLKSDSEYYGEYEFVLSEDSKNYIQKFIELYNMTGMLELWEDVSKYKMGSDIYLEDYTGKQVVPVSEGKPFIIYFASTAETEQTATSKKLKVDVNTSNVSIVKASANETDPNIYILPSDISVDKELFRNTIANADFIYSEDRAISDLYNITDHLHNLVVYFNADGTPVFAIHNPNIQVFVEYAQIVFNQELTMIEVLESLAKTK